MLEEVIEI